MSTNTLFAQNLLAAAREFEAELIGWRRHIHQHPELSGQEAATAAFVANQLHEMGLKPVTGYAGTHAISAWIEGGSGPTVALRADMDALPIDEQNVAAYCSQAQGVMHACGHDAHTAMLLGAARLLCAKRAELKGTVQLIFQPAEESAIHDGAAALVAAGILSDPPVSAIFGLHVYPELPVGTLATRPGPMMASADDFRVVIHGQGGHAARPQQCIDPILIAAEAVSALHHLVSRRLDPLQSAVLTIGWIRGGQTENVIPDKVEFGGTVRSLNSAQRNGMPELIRQTVEGIAAAYGGRAELHYQLGCSPVVNDADAAEFAFATLGKLAGSDRVLRLAQPSMGGEDFGAYLEAIPGCFIRIGTRSPEQASAPPLHSPHFDIDESALALGSAALASLAIAWLEDHH